VNEKVKSLQRKLKTAIVGSTTDTFGKRVPDGRSSDCLAYLLYLYVY